MPRDQGPPAQVTHCAMGTVMTHKAFGPQAQTGLQAACREVARIEGLLSRFLPASDVSRVNGRAGIRSERTSPETYQVLSTAAGFSREFPGCFDVTIQPLVALWSSARHSLAAPGESSIRQVLPLVNHRDLLLDPGKRTAGLANPGQAVDLGGIGKGFAADRIPEIYREHGISSAFSNLGGNVVTVGARPDGSPWRIGIQHPRRAGSLIGAVSAVDETVVTSGDYQRFFTDAAGKRHHHILDPTTGYPADSGLISVTIVATRSIVADPLSTIVFVAGLERGLHFLQRLPGAEAVLVGADMAVYVTPGLRTRFQAADGVNVILLD